MNTAVEMEKQKSSRIELHSGNRHKLNTEVREQDGQNFEVHCHCYEARRGNWHLSGGLNTLLRIALIIGSSVNTWLVPRCSLLIGSVHVI